MTARRGFTEEFQLVADRLDVLASHFPNTGIEKLSGCRLDWRLQLSTGDVLYSCNKCAKWKSLESFELTSNGLRGRSLYCTLCRAAKRNEAGDKSFKSFKWNLKKKYGMSYEEYSALRYVIQGNQCALCLSELSLERKKTAVDHCHVTGRVRGVLCTNCNVGLGKFRDSAPLLAKAAEYVIKL